MDKQLFNKLNNSLKLFIKSVYDKKDSDGKTSTGARSLKEIQNKIRRSKEDTITMIEQAYRHIKIEDTHAC